MCIIGFAGRSSRHSRPYSARVLDANDGLRKAALNLLSPSRTAERDPDLALRTPRARSFRVQHSDDARSAYVAFKSSSVEFAALLDGRRWTRALRLLTRRGTWGRPTLPQNQEAFVRVTSRRVSGSGAKPLWWRDPGGDSASKAVETWQKLPYVTS